MSFLITDAFATTGAPAQQGGMGSIVMLVGFVVLFYFLLWWPQSRKLKAHRNLVDNLQKDDEVITSGGMVGKITKISDDFISLMIAPNVEISIQKASVGAVVPKGTLKI